MKISPGGGQSFGDRQGGVAGAVLGQPHRAVSRHPVELVEERRQAALQVSGLVVYGNHDRDRGESRVHVAPQCRGTPPAPLQASGVPSYNAESGLA